MKKLYWLLSIIILSAGHAYSNHILGSEIHYEYIGDTSGVADQYMVYLTIYRGADGIPIPPSVNVDINSSCWSFTVPVNPYSEPGDSVIPGEGIYLPNRGRCVNQAFPGFQVVQAHKFRGIVNLPSKCSDIVFSWNMCCRRSDADNLVKTGPYDDYVEAHLDNTISNNNSVRLLNSVPGAWCIGQEVYWPQLIEEKDQDSVLIGFSHPLSPGSSVSPIPYEPGYSKFQPLSSAGGITFTDAMIRFVPTQQELGYVKVKAIEYKFDTLSTSWLLAGSSEFDVAVIISASCSPTSASLDFYIPDSLSIQGNQFEVNCGTDSILVRTSTPFVCQSLYDDGFFQLIRMTDSISLPVVDLGVLNCDAGITNEFWLKLHQPLNDNSTYELQIRKGLTGKTLINSCGYEVPEYEGVTLLVQNCGQVGLTESNLTDISIHPNPTTGRVHMEFEDLVQSGKIFLRNSVGQVISKYKLSNQNSSVLEINGPSGIYFLTVEIKGDRQTFKVVKQ